MRDDPRRRDRADLPGADDRRSARCTPSATRSSRRSCCTAIAVSKAASARARDIEAAARRRHPEARAAHRRLFLRSCRGGLRQRAMIAMALSLRAAPADRRRADDGARRHHPGADPGRCCASCRREHGMAIMLITHDLGVIAEMADDVVVMYLGRVVEEGPVDDIFHAPEASLHQALLRSIPSIYGRAARRGCRRSAARSRIRSTGRRAARSIRVAPPSWPAAATASVPRAACRSASQPSVSCFLLPRAEACRP